MKILIVEDNPDSRNLLVKQLQAYGHKIIAATNGSEALQQALVNLPDIIISDIQMPEMDGYQLCREWKQNELLKRIPFIIYTATYTSSEDEQFALSLGVNAFIRKPTEPETLLHILSDIIDRAENGSLSATETEPMETSRYLTEHNKILIAKLDNKIKRLQQEIEEHKKDKAALIESRKQYQTLIETANEAITVTQDTHFQFINHAMFELLPGYAEQEFTSRPFTDFIHPDDRDMVIQNHQKRLKGEAIPNRYSFRVVTADNAVKWVEISAVLIEWNGRPATLNFLTDISERRKAEEALRQSAEEWSATFNSITDLLCILDKEQRIIRVNKHFGEILRVPPAAIEGHYCFQKIHGTDHSLPFCPHVKALKSGKTETTEYFEPKLGFHIEETISPVFDKNGTLTGTIHIMKDVTERKKAEEENSLLREKSEVSSRMAAIGEMAAGIAHEINNPLTSVIGFSELLVTSDEISSELKEHVRIIADGSNRVKEIVKRLLNFARQSKSVKTCANINELIESTLNLRSYVLKTANVEVIKNLSQDLPWITVDAGQMQQVFLNIIVNAEYSMKKAHGKGTLTITTETNDGNIRISLKDDGAGMTNDVKSKLFTPFFTTKSGEGTGLGLSLSHSIIVGHGGTIEVESEQGKGAEFVITLPVAPLPEAPSAESGISVNSQGENSKSAHILVVDDEEAIRMLISRTLANSGHTVEATGRPEEVLQKLSSCCYDMIIMDIRMPGMNGMELYRSIRDWQEK
jgi:PAS domain S-box-containing protein